MDVIAHLERMAGLSAEMRAAAQANDWDRLAAIESEMAALRDMLMAREPGGRQSEALPESELLRKAALIEQILADSDEVRKHTDPHLESTRKLLAGVVLDQNVRKAYGV